MAWHITRHLGKTSSAHTITHTHHTKDGRTDGEGDIITQHSLKVPMNEQSQRQRMLYSQHTTTRDKPSESAKLKAKNYLHE